ncbi:MAG: GH36-type glycosyl hydrolase domain-containing protein [Candidatus Helarchaeota archaeon]
MDKKAFGSGYFGEWIKDEFGLPAYKYNCDQINDPKAISPTNEFWRKKTNHSHQIGNDRLIGVASNYGYIQVRQDEGSPKFLNDYDPSRYQYGGGLGFLTDGNIFLSTYYPGNADSFDRIFGMGYYRKIVKGHGLSVDQIIFAPFGDDPLLISQVTITNNRDKPVDLNWIEYWGCRIYQFSYKAFMAGLISKKSTVPDIRRNFTDKFIRKFSKINDHDGILVSRKFLGFKLIEHLLWGVMNLALATIARSLSGGSVKTPVKESTLEDKTPPDTFLVSLDKPTDELSIDARNFFGSGGVENPSGIFDEFQEDFNSTEENNGLFLKRKIKLNSGEKKTLYFAFGYVEDKNNINSIVNHYKKNYKDLFEKSCAKWNRDRIKLSIHDDKWIDRELKWHYYYLRSNLTFDSFFKEHILSQGHVYQYLIGFQGASRDPCQHALPFIYSDPRFVKEIIRYTCKTVKPKGEIPYGIVGNGVIQPSPFKPSDLELWLLWLTSEYVLAWRDLDFLNEKIPMYPIYKAKNKEVRIIDILQLCYNHFINITGVGIHGLQKLSNGDWNDMVILGYVPKKRQKSIKNSAESVLNSAMAVYTLDLYSKLMNFTGKIDLAEKIKLKAEELKSAVKKQWANYWFKRAWLSQEYGWVGEDILWLEPQPWTIIGGIADQDQIKILLKSIDEKLRKSSKIGATILNEPISHVTEEKGMATNGGIWLSINGTLIWALALTNPEMALDEWKKNSLAYHAEAFPEIWYGIWSGPDTYNSHFSEFEGATLFFDPNKKAKGLNVNVNWTDFPVMNMHSHAWPLYSVIKLLGIEFSPNGLEIKPSIPKDEYEFYSPLIMFKKTENGYTGHYSPNKIGNWKISIILPENEIENIEKLEVNGKSIMFNKEQDRIEFEGKSSAKNPLKWTIIKKFTQ